MPILPGNAESEYLHRRDGDDFETLSQDSWENAIRSREFAGLEFVSC
jgi:hypothetical protein